MPVLAEGMGPSAAAVVGLLDFLVIVAALVWPGRQQKIGHTCPAPGPAAPSTAVPWRTRGADPS